MTDEFNDAEPDEILLKVPDGKWIWDCDAQKAVRWSASMLSTGKFHRYVHQDDDMSKICTNSYCRCWS